MLIIYCMDWMLKLGKFSGAVPQTLFTVAKTMFRQDVPLEKRTEDTDNSDKKVEDK